MEFVVIMDVMPKQQVRWSATLRRIHRWLALLAVIPIFLWLLSGLYIAASDDLSRWLSLASALHLMDLGSGKPYVLLFIILLALSVSVVGIWLIFYSFNPEDPRRPKLGLLRGLHKWLGIIVGIQMLLWIISALVLSLGFLNQNNDQLSPSPLSPALDATKISVNQLVVNNPQASQLVVISGQNMPLVKLVNHPENQGIAGNALPGRSVREFFYMLHIMDYANGRDINNPLLISAGVTALLFAATGLMTLIAVFSGLGGSRIVKAKSFEITVLSRHGYVDTMMVDGGQPLLAALALKGFSLPSGCGGSGTCCQCMVKTVRMNSPITVQEQTSLSVNEINQGFRLACQTQVKSDLAIEVSDLALAQQEFEVEVISNQFLTPLIKELVVSLACGVNFTFDPGQSVNFHIPVFSQAMNRIVVPPQYQSLWQHHRLAQYLIANQQAIVRSYSMASSPSLNNKLVFNVALALPKKGYGPGVASSYLFGLQPGDRLILSGPLGEFVTDSDSRREMVFVGAGAGMAPLKSHIDTVIASQSRRKISLWFGARTENDIFYQQHFDQLALRHRNFRWTVSLSQPDSDRWQGAAGHIQQELFEGYLAHHRDIAECDFFLCGPPLMIKDITRLLRRRGVNDSQILSDDFGGSF